MLRPVPLRAHRTLGLLPVLLLACVGDAGSDSPGPGDAAAPDVAEAPDAGTGSDASDAAEAPDAADGLPAPEPTPAYPGDRTHSPLTPRVVAGLRAVAERGAEAEARDDVFAKVGASSTKSRSFLHCFAGEAVDLGGRPHLRPTLEHFRDGDAAGTDPYQRESETVTVGWSAWSALAGDPSPVERELAAIRPSLALIMYGTNDIQARNPVRYAGNMLDLTDLLLRRGVIPLLFTVMPRDDDARADALVPLYNAIVRGVAQGRGVPLIDYHRVLAPLPDHGLGPDRLHPSTYRADGRARACDLGEDGLRHGYNLRNLLALESLERVRRAVWEEEPAPDGAPVGLAGDGSPGSPYEIERLPFTHLADLSDGVHRRIHAYPGCDAEQDESGPEHLYILRLEAPTTIQVHVFDRGDVDIDVHILDASADGEGCVARGHHEASAALEAGTWHIALDTFVSDGEELAGEHLLVLLAAPPER